MPDYTEGLIDRFRLAGAEFTRRLTAVRPRQWTRPTPCAEWNVRLLVNHVVRGNLNYLALAHGGTAADFLRRRDEDALGADPVTACIDSFRDCATTFTAPGVLDELLDYPLGTITGAQALAVRTADTVIHTWDLARAVDADERLHPGLVDWITEFLGDIYAGLPETPTAADTTHRFFAAPTAAPEASRQDRLLRTMGREP